MEGIHMIVPIRSTAKGRIITRKEHRLRNEDIVIYKVGIGKSLLENAGEPLEEGQEFHVKVLSPTELELYRAPNYKDLVRVRGGERTNLVKDDYFKKQREWLNEHQSSFQELDTQVKGKTLEQFRSSFVSKHIRGDLSKLEYRAVTLAQLRNFAQDVKRRCVDKEWDVETLKTNMAPNDGPPCSGSSLVTEITWENITWYHVQHLVILQQTAGLNCSFAETITDVPQRGQYHFAYGWNMKLCEFMKGIEWLVEARQMPDTAPLLVHTLAVNLRSDEYHRGASWEIGMDACEYIVFAGELRAGPLLDAHRAISKNKSIDLMCGTGVLSLVRPFPAGSWELGRFDLDIASALVDIDVSTATAYVASVRQRLEEIGNDAHSSLTKKLRIAGAGPTLREAAYRDNTQKVKHVLKQCPWLSLQSPRLQGPLGETPLHVAASAGSTKTMQLLIRKGADVNAVDCDGETPLHLAALAGKQNSVNLLLDAGADSTQASYFSETPLEVAKQQPAFFVPEIDYGPVQALLEAHPDQHCSFCVGS